MDKRKRFEISEKSHKKLKADKKCGIVGITNDGYNLISDWMAEVWNESWKNMDERHPELVSTIMDLLQTLCIVVKEVRVAVEWELYPSVSWEEDGSFEECPVELPSMPPQRKIQMVSKVIDLGTLEHNAMIKDIDHVNLYFSVVSMYLLYTI